MITLEYRLSNEAARKLVEELDGFLDYEADRMASGGKGEPALGYALLRGMRVKLRKEIERQDTEEREARRARREARRPTVRQQYRKDEEA